MANNYSTYAAVHQTEAALEGIRDSLALDVSEDQMPTYARPDFLLTPLARYGDAIRLGIETPRSLRRWFERCSPGQLEAALRCFLDEMRDWYSSESYTDVDFAWLLRRRDEAESVRKAVLRVQISKTQVYPFGVDALRDLEDRLCEVDKELRVFVSSNKALRLLGNREAYDPEWVYTFREDTDDDHEA
jgi:hypothetical protein